MKKSIIIFWAAAAVIIAGAVIYFSTIKTPELPDKNQNQNNSREIKTRKITLYYYNPQKDKDKSGNVLCSRAGLAPVLREIRLTKTPIQDALNLLLKGDLTESEKQAGIAPEFPLPGLMLQGVNLASGILSLTFADPQNKTSGGACRAGVLWFQIEATARQFAGVHQVRFIPETLFQP